MRGKQRDREWGGGGGERREEKGRESEGERGGGGIKPIQKLLLPHTLK